MNKEDIKEDNNAQSLITKPESKVLYDEENIDRDTPEGVKDEPEPFGINLKVPENQIVEPDNRSPKSPNDEQIIGETESDKNDIPIVSYSDDSKSSIHSEPQNRVLDSDLISAKTISEPNTPI